MPLARLGLGLGLGLELGLGLGSGLANPNPIPNPNLGEVLDALGLARARGAGGRAAQTHVQRA